MFICSTWSTVLQGELDQQETGKSKKGLFYLSSEKMEEYLQRNEDKQDEIRLNIANLIQAESERKKQLRLEDVMLELKGKELVEEKRQQRLEDIMQELKGRELVEEKRHQRLEDIMQELKGRELVEEKRQQDNTNYLQHCQTILGDFVFFLVSSIVWLLHTHEKHPTQEYYFLLYVISTLSFVGLLGYTFSHFARANWLVKTVYTITVIEVFSIIALVGYAIYSFIPSDYEFHNLLGWVYIGAVLATAIILGVACCFNRR